jgi:hypothetical protein
MWIVMQERLGKELTSFMVESIARQLKMGDTMPILIRQLIVSSQIVKTGLRYIYYL